MPTASRFGTDDVVVTRDDHFAVPFPVLRISPRKPRQVVSGRDQRFGDCHGRQRIMVEKIIPNPQGIAQRPFRPKHPHQVLRLGGGLRFLSPQVRSHSVAVRWSTWRPAVKSSRPSRMAAISTGEGSVRASFFRGVVMRSVWPIAIPDAIRARHALPTVKKTETVRLRFFLPPLAIREATGSKLSLPTRHWRLRKVCISQCRHSGNGEAVIRNPFFSGHCWIPGSAHTRSSSSSGDKEPSKQHRLAEFRIASRFQSPAATACIR